MADGFGDWIDCSMKAGAAFAFICCLFYLNFFIQLVVLLILGCVGFRYGRQDIALQCMGSRAAVDRFLTEAHRLQSAQAQ